MFSRDQLKRAETLTEGRFRAGRCRRPHNRLGFAYQAPSLLEHVSAIEGDNVVLYGQYVLVRKLVRRR